MNLILETDIGRDADDFFTLLYLLANPAVNVRAITVSPGDKDQVTLVKTILKECGATHIPVGVGKLDRDKNSVGGMHLKFLAKYGDGRLIDHDEFGPTLVKNTMAEYPDAECLCIGPLHSIGGYLLAGGSLGRCTMQGGFVGYEQHNVAVERLDKFEGLDKVETFNLGGYKQGSQAFVFGDVRERQFVGKNVCHTILYGEEQQQFVKSDGARGREHELFIQAMDMYLAEQPFKAFHDPTAAVCHLHPEIGTWMEGKLAYKQGKWGGHPETPGDQLLIDIDRNALWEHIKNFD